MKNDDEDALENRRPAHRRRHLMTALLAATGVALLVDPRQIMGAPAWMKPAKFAASIAIYTFTLAWVFTYLPEWARTRRVVSWVTAVTLLLEIVIIDVQAWRGTPATSTSAPFSTACSSRHGHRDCRSDARGGCGRRGAVEAALRRPRRSGWALAPRHDDHDRRRDDGRADDAADARAARMRHGGEPDDGRPAPTPLARRTVDRDCPAPAGAANTAIFASRTSSACTRSRYFRLLLSCSPGAAGRKFAGSGWCGRSRRATCRSSHCCCGRRCADSRSSRRIRRRLRLWCSGLHCRHQRSGSPARAANLRVRTRWCIEERIMSAEHIFSIANTVALCGWLLLIVLPGKKWVSGLVAGVAIPAAFAALYTCRHRNSFCRQRWRFFVAARCGACSSAIPGCCSPDGFTTSRSICSSGVGRRVTRASAASATCSSSHA